MRTKRPSQSPRGQRRAHFDNVSILGDEGHVDRKLHEEGVDRVGGRDDERGRLWKRAMAKESDVSGLGVNGELQAAGDDGARAGVAQMKTVG